jgi:hypothetical protein
MKGATLQIHLIFCFRHQLFGLLPFYGCLKVEVCSMCSAIYDDYVNNNSNISNMLPIQVAAPSKA